MAERSRSKTGFAIVNGTQLYYETEGTGQALILIHGGLVDSRMWDDQFSVFAHQYHTARYDLRGTGKSAMSAGDYSDRDDLFHLLLFLGIEHIYLLGSSGGAALAIDFTLQHPEMVGAIIVAAPGLSGYTWSAETLQMADDFISYWQAGDIPKAVEARLRMLTDGPHRQSHDVNRAVRERVGEMIAHALTLPQTDYASQALEPPAMPRLSEIKVPVLIIVGDQDVPEILSVGELLEKRIKGGQKRVLPASAHMVNMERPNEFNSYVLEFLSHLRDRS